LGCKRNNFTQRQRGPRTHNLRQRASITPEATKASELERSRSLKTRRNDHDLRFPGLTLNPRFFSITMNLRGILRGKGRIFPSAIVPDTKTQDARHVALGCNPNIE